MDKVGFRDIDAWAIGIRLVPVDKKEIRTQPTLWMTSKQ